MRLRDENKRQLIVEAATRLFSEQPFHKVRLDDVAAAAGIGKGTLYIYFKSKEDLYYSLASTSLGDMCKSLTEQVAAQHAGGEPVTFSEQIRAIIFAMVNFAIQTPRLFEAMRTAGIPEASSQWDIKRQENANLLEHVIRQGIAAGEFEDARPEQTALYIPGMLRAVMLYGGPDKDNAQKLTSHIVSIVLKGIAKEQR